MYRVAAQTEARLIAFILIGSGDKKGICFEDTGTNAKVFLAIMQAISLNKASVIPK